MVAMKEADSVAEGNEDRCDRAEARMATASRARQATGAQGWAQARIPEGSHASRGARRSADASERDRPQPGVERTGGATSYDPAGKADAEVKTTPRWPVA